MILDTSALIAILQNEPEAQRFALAIAEADRCTLSAANYVEAAIMIDGSRNPVASRRFDDLLREAAIVIAPVTEEQAKSHAKPIAILAAAAATPPNSTSETASRTPWHWQ